MRYFVSYSGSPKNFIDITCIIENVNSETIDVHLPSWRPGRYELGNFAKNVQKWNAEDENGNSLKSYKISKDHWKIETDGSTTVFVKYNYFAAELNAGSTFADDTQLFINPVNCLLYAEGKTEEVHTLELEIPEQFKIATSLPQVKAAPPEKKTKNPDLQKKPSKTRIARVSAKNFDELADSPLLASDSLKRNHFVYEGIEFNLWFQGECQPDWGTIIGDFFIFVNEQYELFKEFPSREFHFLFQILPYKFHHGVEHLKSTVIALGPGYNLGSSLYDEFLGVCSHELFHCWNIKSIRPVEMMPYDFSKENYSTLGYVAEGVTTYYGDLMLFRSGIFSEFDYSKKLSDNVQKHFENFGRNFRSLAESSFDTWLDGYGKAIPNRVMSIYADGCILAFMADILIRINSENKFSLDDVMRKLYYDFAKQGKGYSENDYKNLIETCAGNNFDVFFKNYVWGNSSFEAPLKECLDYLGCELISRKPGKFYEAHWGIKTSVPSSLQKERGEIISSVYPDSVADNAGLCVNDELISINGFELKNDLAGWSKYFSFKPMNLIVKRGSRFIGVKLTASKDVFYKIYFINKLKNPSGSQVANFEKWSRRKF